MQNRRLILNSISSLALQVTTLICGFILPRLILTEFGSEVNGLINSITQFLQIISFMELGVGAVVQSSLYKPLADHDTQKISTIIVSANNFFKKLAQILLVYSIVLMGIYPLIAKQNFNFIFSASLIAIMCISSFVQYYFGIVDGLLLSADQQGYVQYITQTLTLILNTFVCYVFIKLGASIHVVKLSTSLIYLLRPLFLRWYINRHYNINRDASYVEEPIPQKWNGVAQHIASVILNGTDNIILTVFSGLADVSIYSVYHLVLYGIKQLFMSLTTGFQSLLGELWAKQELEKLKKTFSWIEWSLHTATIFIFGCTGMLILPFIKIYTNGIHDAEYIQPVFAVLITMAHAGHCLRLPYNILILAAGHYRQTQQNYIIAASMNLLISIIAVWKLGLIGVAMGTLIAMFYQTFWMAMYDSRNIIRWPFHNFLKQLTVDFISVLIGVLCTKDFILSNISYISWILLAAKTAIIWFIVICILNLIFYREKMKNILWLILKIH